MRSRFAQKTNECERIVLTRRRQPENGRAQPIFRSERSLGIAAGQEIPTFDPCAFNNGE